MIVSSFILLDFENKVGRKFKFDNGTNLIVSKKNSQGKSTLLKSLYFTLGFDIKQFPTQWDINIMVFQVEVIIKEIKYIITRHKNTFRTSDSNGAMNVREYSDWLLDKLQMNMKLPNIRTNSLFNAYSSAVLLPFYIDQDDSWSGGLYKGVSPTLNQYKNIPVDVFKYYFSLSDDYILELTNEKNEYQKQIKIIESMISNLTLIVEEFNEKNKKEPIIQKINKSNFKDEINKYLEILNDFNHKATSFKMKLLIKQEQVNKKKLELVELEKLLKMNKKRVKSIEYECTNCHSILTTEQSLTRFDLSSNYFELSLYRDEVKKEVLSLEENLKKIKNEQINIEKTIDELLTKIEKSRELMSINSYIEINSKIEAEKELSDTINIKKIKLVDLKETEKNITKEINELKTEKKVQSDALKTKYNELVFKMQQQICDIQLTELEFLKFNKISGSGINNNKKYLAYYLIYFSLLKNFSMYSIPFCMDSFIKNEITGESAKEMFGAIEKYLFDVNFQSFFSIVSDNLVHFKYLKNYNVINLDEKLLLDKKYYEELSKQIILN